MLPVFDAYTDGPDAYDLTGLGRGGANIARLKKNYNKVRFPLILLLLCFLRLSNCW